MSRRSSANTRSAEAPGDLTRLLETEQRLEGELRVAREQAELLRREAMEAARGREAGIDAALAAAERASVRKLVLERRRREADLAAVAARTIVRYEQVDDSRIDAVAHQLLDRLLAGWEGGGP